MLKPKTLKSNTPIASEGRDQNRNFQWPVNCRTSIARQSNTYWKKYKNLDQLERWSSECDPEKTHVCMLETPHTIHEKKEPISKAPDEFVRLRMIGFSVGIGQVILAMVLEDSVY